MKGIRLATFLLIFALTGCAGLPQPREMGDVALLRAMGVDWTEEKLEMTVSTGPRADGNQAEGQGALVLSARSDTFSSGALSIRGQSDSSISFGHVDQLLLGEELSRLGVREVLDYFAKDGELGLGAQLWVLQEQQAKTAVESGDGRGIEGRLAALRTDGERGLGPIPRTAGEVYADLLERGCAYVPALKLSEGENPRLEEGGYAILKGEKLVGYLEGDSARGLELLVGGRMADVLEVPLGEETVTVQITGAATASRLSRERDTLALSCRVWAQLAEYRRLPEEGELEQLQREIVRLEEEKVRLALAQLTAWQTDCLGLGAKAGILSPVKWSSVSENWSRYFGEQMPKIHLSVELTR